MQDWTQVATAVATVATAIVAAVALIFAGSQVREMRKTRQDTAQPYVVAYMEPVPSAPDLVNIVVRNFGLTAAFNVSFRATPPLDRSGDPGPSPLAVFDVLPIMAPGQMWTTYFDRGSDRVKQGLALRFRVDIDYRDAQGRKMPTSKCVLDWSIFEHRAWVVEKDLADVAKTLDRLTKRFLQVTDSTHVKILADDAVHARRVSRVYRALTGEPVVNRSEAAAMYDRLRDGSAQRVARRTHELRGRRLRRARHRGHHGGPGPR